MWALSGGKDSPGFFLELPPAWHANPPKGGLARGRGGAISRLLLVVSVPDNQTFPLKTPGNPVKIAIDD